MNYQDELLAKLSSVAPPKPKEKVNVVDVTAQEAKILEELDREFVFGQYDLDESDILRTLKIIDILNLYESVFSQKNGLRLFYIIARVDVIPPKNLLLYSKLPVSEFKGIINAMAQSHLIMKNESGELELTLEGKSLATRIGIDIYL